MDKTFIESLKQPCKNRGVYFGGATLDGVLLDGQEFTTMKEAEDYLESKPRVDLNEIDEKAKELVDLKECISMAEARRVIVSGLYDKLKERALKRKNQTKE